MLINVIKFAKLFDDEIFLRWMRANAPDELKEVTDAKEDGFQHAVINVYNKLYNSLLKRKFQEFIVSKFPEIISQEQEELPLTARLIVPPRDDPNKVFSCYNPQLLRLPMQIMFQSDDVKQLELAISSFVAKLRGERLQMIIGDMAYIEYVPNNFVKRNIHKDNWEIKSWKAKNKVR
jgi:hypothetical protein